MIDTRRSTAVAALLLLGLPAFAQTPTATPTQPSKPLSTSLGMVVFPAKGQSAQQQAQDEGECYAWSKGQTEVDPMAPAPAPVQPAAEPAKTAPAADGSRVRGAARGAAAGAIIGEVADDDAGKGAAIGATVGAMRGGAVSRRNQQQAAEQAAQQQQQSTQQQQAAQQQQLDLFKKGFAACLEPKGYTVK
jgi:uncharacterized protein YcfJ